MKNDIPRQTIETVARSIFKEASDYGFGPLDFVRLINELMDLAKGTSKTESGTAPAAGATASFDALPAAALPLEGSRLAIRAFDPEADRELLERWLPDRYGRYFMLSSATAQHASIDTLVEAPSNHVAIVTLLDGRPIGAMAYLDHNTEQRRAELRKLIGDTNARGRGYAEEATRLWVRYGFDGLGLEKIYLSTLQTHIRNIKLNEDVGFVVEGLLRNEVLIDGKRHDVLRMATWKV